MFGIGSHMPIRQTFWYAVEEYDADERYRVVSIFRDPQDRAVDAAEDFQNNHDGWESTFPLTFILFDSEDGPPASRHLVEREIVPQFHAGPALGVDGGRTESPEAVEPSKP